MNYGIYISKVREAKPLKISYEKPPKNKWSTLVQAITINNQRNKKKMKPLILLLILCSSYNSNSQIIKDESKTNYPVIGFSTGYSLPHSVLNAGLQFGYRSGNIYLSGDMIIPLTSNVFVPKIFAANLGLNISQFQPFISCSYQTIGAESEQYYKGTPDEFINGFRLGYGIRYYPLKIPLNFNVQKQGKEIILSTTLYKAL